jgi:hypothetical protein
VHQTFERVAVWGSSSGSGAARFGASVRDDNVLLNEDWIRLYRMVVRFHRPAVAVGAGGQKQRVNGLALTVVECDTALCLLSHRCLKAESRLGSFHVVCTSKLHKDLTGSAFGQLPVSQAMRKC